MCPHATMRNMCGHLSRLPHRLPAALASVFVPSVIVLVYYVIAICAGISAGSLYLVLYNFNRINNICMYVIYFFTNANFYQCMQNTKYLLCLSVYIQNV